MINVVQIIEAKSNETFKTASNMQKPGSAFSTWYWLTNIGLNINT